VLSTGQANPEHEMFWSLFHLLIDKSPGLHLQVIDQRVPPLSVVLTLDTSGSMSKRMKGTQDAAMSFLNTLGSNDSIQVVTFAREVKPVTTMSSDRKAAREAIGSTFARGDTALYSALWQSVQLLKERTGRKAVVVLSDGIDDDGTGNPLSKQTLKDVFSLANEVNVPIYVLALGTEIDKAGLMAVANETGALYFEAPQANELKALYGQIGAQPAGQYAISYSSSLPEDGTERRVTLTAQEVTDTKAYKAPGTQHAVNQPNINRNTEVNQNSNKFLFGHEAICIFQCASTKLRQLQGQHEDRPAYSDHTVGPSTLPYCTAFQSRP
jgi:hypothetical protein